MMFSKETAKYSLKKLAHRKARSILTIFSILLGIMTIFIFISFGIGLYSYVNEFTTGSSADKITIMPRGVGAPGLDDTFALTEDDLSAIEGTSGVFAVSGHYIKVAEISKGKQKIYSFLAGYEANERMIFQISNIGLEKGRWLKQGDNNKVLLGYNYLIQDRIFSKELDLNDNIEIQGVTFRVVGFVEEVGNPQDDSQIYMLNDDIVDLYGADLKGYSMIIARVDSTNIPGVINRVENNLRKSRNVDKGKEDFFVQSWDDLLETYSSVLNGIVGFIILIALISVVVSAINTANTMITSVIERIKEIGIIKSIGARNEEVFNIFLFESGFLGFVSGVLGVLLGWAVTHTAGTALDAAGWGFLNPYYSWQLFGGLILFATLTGAISGVVPAYRASRINPVDALRYE